MIANFQSTAYGWLMLVGIFVSIVLWSKLARRDSRLVLIYIAALTGAFLGAKVAYLIAEGWMRWHDENRWLQLATGKSVTGALFGGYAGVEIAKHFLGYSSATGDSFAIIAPVGIMFGRVGCMIHGCCLGRACEASWFTMTDAQGIARWPASQVEFLFNAVALAGILLLRSRRILPNQHFHIYLVSYGLFRFVHEFWRDTPRWGGVISGYQLIALTLVVLGVVRFWQRMQTGGVADLAGQSASAEGVKDSGPNQ